MMMEMVYRRPHITWLVLAFALVACRDTPSMPRDRGTRAEKGRVDRREGAAVAATVDGVPIYASEVTELIRDADAGLTQNAALEVLVRETLLSNEAERRGFSDAPEVKATREAALASLALKTEVEEGVTPKTIEEKTLRNYYDAERGRFVHDEKRRVVHFVALTGAGKLADDAARALAESVYDAVKGVASAAVFEERAKAVMDAQKENGKVESLPPFEKTSRQFVAPFVDAVFDISREKGISRPIRTTFGWHVIFLAEIIPPKNQPFEAVREELIDALLPKLRRERAADLMARLLEEGKPFIYEDALAQGNIAP
jgi:peptidyl-prolyl cis-trans isomerase C